MGRNTKNISKKSGLMPGSLVHVGKISKDRVRISCIDYYEDNYKEKIVYNIDEINLKEPTGIHWINVDGLNDISILEKIGKRFNVHRLLLEDILDTTSRPKVDETNNVFFMILKMIYLNDTEKIICEQVSILLCGNYIITFQEQIGDVFDSVRKRIFMDKGPIRKKGADYLCYALIDSIVDNYFVILENFEDKIEILEEELVGNPDKATLKKIYDIKNELIFLKKSIWPLRDVLNCIYHGDFLAISNNITIYIKDVYEHVIQINDTIQLFLDSISNMLDIYLSSVSNKMNEIMKVLTIFSTIFIPLSFIVGVYGMNFDNMPELKFKHGYLILWIVMISVTINMLYYFKKKKWF